MAFYPSKFGAGNWLDIVSIPAAAPRTYTLPDVTTVPRGKSYIIKDGTGTADTVEITVLTTGAQTIDGDSSRIINTRYGLLTFVSTGTAWYVADAYNALFSNAIGTQLPSAVNFTGGTMSGVTVTNLPSPTNAGDAATKSYVDSLKSSKDPMRLATAATLPSFTFASDVLTATANGALSVDETVTALNDRVLVKNETGANAKYNGLYFLFQVGTGSLPWKLKRTTDADTSAEMKSGITVTVSEGSANADSTWILSTNDPITLNTTDLTFTQTSGAGQVTAGAGLTKTGNTLDVGAGTGISVTADAVGIAAGGVGTTEIANTAVTPAKADLSMAWTFTGGLTANGGLTLKRTAVTTNYTILSTDFCVSVTDTTAQRTITLPAAATAGAGKAYVIKDGSGLAATNNIVVDGNGAELIDGAATNSINTNYGSLSVVSTGVGWEII